ncbi:MAG TPA: hypothetical protein VFZ45_01875 [Actinomycetota bacterium]|nr:hypothetical protein [Actinomycetota bacterium]
MTILVVALTLLLSRLDLANELDVVRSELTAANEEVAESEAELDQLQEEARMSAQTIATCREAAELGEEVRAAFQTLRRGLDRGNEGTIAQGVVGILQVEGRWAEASERCLEAAEPADQG